MLGHLTANDQTSTQTDESIKGIVLCHVTNKLQASRTWIQAFTQYQQKSFCLRFLALFPVLTSLSGRLLSRLCKLASSTSRFLSYQLHYSNERRGSLPSSCTNMPGIDTQWCGVGHMTIPRQAGIEWPSLSGQGIEHSDWLSRSHMPTSEPWTNRGGMVSQRKSGCCYRKKRGQMLQNQHLCPVPENWDGFFSLHKPLLRNLLLEHYPTGPFPLFHKSN